MAQTVSTSALTPQSFFQTTLSGNITASDTTIPLNSLPTANEGYIVLESTSSTAREVLHFTSKTGSAVVCGSTGDRGLFGTTAQSHSSGALVEDNWVTGYWLDLQSAAALSSSAILQKHLANPTEGQFGNNFVSSGFGVTGVSSSLVATLASGIAYVAGSRVLPAVGGHTYQAASDTYIDVKSDASLTFAGGTSGNSGASVPITANSIRVARVNTHATGINIIHQTGLGAINASLSIAKFEPSGANVYPVIPPSRLLGYAQSSGAFATASTTNVQIPGISVTVTVPANVYFLKISASAGQSMQNNGAGNAFVLAVWDGVVSTGTQLANALGFSPSANQQFPMALTALQPVVPGATKTYNLGMNAALGGTASTNSGSGNPIFLMVEIA